MLAAILASGFCGLDNSRCDDSAVRSSDAIFFELAGNDGLDLVLQSQGNLGDFDSRDGRGNSVILGVRKD